MVVSGEVYKQRTCISKINYCRTESKSEKGIEQWKHMYRRNKGYFKRILIIYI